MPIQYIPGGLPVTTSFAISSSYTFTSSWAPPTASLAEFALQPIGPQGRNFITASGFTVLITP